MQSRKKTARRNANGSAAGVKPGKRASGSNAKQPKMIRRPKGSGTPKTRAVKQYDHPTKTRLNNPPVGLVTPDTDPDLPPKKYAYDPHMDPQLIWAGKAEKSALTVDTVSLHVHERVDPYTIMEAVRTKESLIEQPSLFAQPSENPPLREALDFYKHQHGWSNRLIAGDSLLVMNSLLEREGMAGQVQMVYVDPPYGIAYGSNFQPFVDRRDVKDGSDEDLTQEPEMIRAFRDTWELGIHSYLTYLRDRFLLARELLSDSGSIFVQIGLQNVHLVRALLDEVFGAQNFMLEITYRTSAPLGSRYVPVISDLIAWYVKDREQPKFRRLFSPKGTEDEQTFDHVELKDGTTRRITAEERTSGKLPNGARTFANITLVAAGPNLSCVFPVSFGGKQFMPTGGRGWKTTEAGMQRLKLAGRLFGDHSVLRYKVYADDFPFKELTNIWTGIGGASSKIYVVQTNEIVIQRCMLMTTEPGDLVLDPTCGSGTTAVVAEQWGRRWITCDTSRVAVTLAKQRLMTSTFDYYELASATDGVDGGLRYKTVPHVTLKSIATDEPFGAESLYDQPEVNRTKVRVTGPFTNEAVPSPMVTEMSPRTVALADSSLSRSGATLRESGWRNELLKSGVRSVGGKFIKFSRVEPLAATSFIHAEAETAEAQPRRVAISFGPEYAPLEQRQVEGAWREAQMLNPQPAILLFAAFQFDPEAAKDIDEMDPRLTRMTFLKVQMDMDLLTRDLKKKRSANESFWLIGKPDVEIRKATGDDKGKYLVEVHGFDYYDVKTGNIESGNADRIAMWMLDTDYDERSVFPRQVFFPMAGEKDGWSKIAKSLRAEIDPELIEAYRGTTSLPFEPGKHGRVAVKIIDDRGVESMRVIKIP